MFLYKYYKESLAANVIELVSYLCLVGTVASIVAVDKSGGNMIWGVMIILSVLAFMVFQIIAEKYYNYTLKKRIASDAAYAKYIAETYPDMAVMCNELNEAYKEYSDTISYCNFNPHRKRNQIIIMFAELILIALAFAGIIMWSS